ncbi:MAG: MFS transporter [Azospirillaceae bacterium]|nr:MFS transporter [Azospirillaceae bacterium]
MSVSPVLAAGDEPATTRPASRVPRHVLAALAAPGIPQSAMSLPLVVYLPQFYSGDLGLGLGLVGSIFMVIRLLDIAFDPFVGTFMDATRTRFGTYRPWLMASVPMVMASIAMLFMAKPGVGPVHLTAWLSLAYAGWSILSLSLVALAANVARDYDERTRAYSWWQAAFMVGMIAAMLLPKGLAALGHASSGDRMQAMAWLVLLLMPLMVLVTMAVVRERSVIKAEVPSTWRDYFGLMRVATVRRVLLTEGLLGLAGGCTSTLTVFFFSWLKAIAPADIGLILVANFVVGLLLTPLWSALATRFSKHRALIVAAVGYAVVQLLFLVVPAGNLGLMVACGAASGAFYGATNMLPRAILADVGDLERLNTGKERSGLLFALLIGIAKVGQALSVGLMFYVLDLVGFNPAPGATNPPLALAVLMGLYGGLAAALSLGAALLIRRHPITAERHADILRQLRERGLT